MPVMFKRKDRESDIVFISFRNGIRVGDSHDIRNNEKDTLTNYLDANFGSHLLVVVLE